MDSHVAQRVSHHTRVFWACRCQHGSAVGSWSPRCELYIFRLILSELRVTSRSCEIFDRQCGGRCVLVAGHAWMGSRRSEHHSSALYCPQASKLSSACESALSRGCSTFQTFLPLTATLTIVAAAHAQDALAPPWTPVQPLACVCRAPCDKPQPTISAQRSLHIARERGRRRQCSHAAWASTSPWTAVRERGRA